MGLVAKKGGEPSLRFSSNGVAYACDLHGLVRKPKPQVLLLPGYYWSYENVPFAHSAADENCQCGVHIAKAIDIAVGYGGLRQSEGVSTVSEHESGWRVEYAYPSELYAVDEEEAIVLSAYGVPIVLSEEISDKKVKRYMQQRALVEDESAEKLVRVIDRAWEAPGIITGMTVAQTTITALNPSVIGIVGSSLTALIPWRSLGTEVCRR